MQHQASYKQEIPLETQFQNFQGMYIIAIVMKTNKNKSL